MLSLNLTNSVLSQNIGSENLFHVFISWLTFAVLAVGGFLAVLLAVQEYLLRHKLPRISLQKLPPLETMETWLFQTVGVGFILLTVVLISSFYFYHSLLWQYAALLQKTVASVFAWLIFLILLLGRCLRGWRGRQAIYYTLVGFLLLLLVLCTSYLLIYKAI